MGDNVNEEVYPMSSVAVDQQFETEIRFYESQKTSWLASHADEFVVISSNELGGFFPTYSQAYEAALAHFGIDKLFLIKQVVPRDQVFVLY